MGYILFDALFNERISSNKHYFTFLGKSPGEMDIFVARFAY